MTRGVPGPNERCRRDAATEAQGSRLHSRGCRRHPPILDACPVPNRSVTAPVGISPRLRSVGHGRPHATSHRGLGCQGREARNGGAAGRAAPRAVSRQLQGGLRARLMVRHVVAALRELPPGSRKVVDSGGQPIVVFNVRGEAVRAVQPLPAPGRQSRGRTPDRPRRIARARRLPLHPARRDPALPLARLGVRRAHPPVVARPRAHPDEELGRRRRARACLAQGAGTFTWPRPSRFLWKRSMSWSRRGGASLCVGESRELG